MKKTVFFSVLVLVLLAIGKYYSPRFFGLHSARKKYPTSDVHQLEFESKKNTKGLLDYRLNSNAKKYKKLREKANLDRIVEVCQTDFAKVCAIQSWVNKQWSHHPKNKPEKKDALYILEEAAKGKRFRCVEYAFVTKECLSALEYQTRVLGLMTKDVSDVESGGGHVVTEVYLPDLKKWIVLDPQFDLIPVQNGVPLNAVELQNCIANGEDFKIINPSQSVNKEFYSEWIGKYLYYFYVSIPGQKLTWWDRLIGNECQLMLLSKDADKPESFQGMHRLNTFEYTHNVNEFYPLMK